MSEHLRREFKTLSTALQDLHRELLMIEAKRLESESGRKISPYDLLHASLHDPGFAWLRLLSTLIVNIDTVIDETTNLSAKEASDTATDVLALLEKPRGQSETEFWTKYSAHLQNPDIIMKHSRVKTLLAGLKPQM